MSYALTEGEYGANEAGDTWVAALMGALGAALTGLQPLLTPDNYDTLVGLLLEDITSRARLACVGETPDAHIARINAATAADALL